MQTALKRSIRETAYVSDLEALIGNTQTELNGTGKLMSRSKRSYHWFAELASRGFRRVEAPLGAHAHLQYLAFGETKSTRTIQRSFKDLSDAGFIYIRKCRRGDILIVDINVERFRFYIQRRKQFIEPPVGTFTHTPLHTTESHPDEFTNYSHKIVSSTSNKSKSHANSIKKQFKDWLPAIVFTFGVITKQLGKAKQAYWMGMVQAAITEQIEPFAYWTDDRWKESPLNVREAKATALLPELKRFAMRRSSPAPRRRESPRPGRKESPPPRRKESPPPRRTDPPPPEPIPITTNLSKEEVTALYWAKRNATQKE
jgi:hypothetical protein